MAFLSSHMNNPRSDYQIVTRAPANLGTLPTPRTMPFSNAYDQHQRHLGSSQKLWNAHQVLDLYNPGGHGVTCTGQALTYGRRCIRKRAVKALDELSGILRNLSQQHPLEAANSPLLAEAVQISLCWRHQGQKDEVLSRWIRRLHTLARILDSTSAAAPAPRARPPPPEYEVYEVEEEEAISRSASHGARATRALPSVIDVRNVPVDRTIVRYGDGSAIRGIVQDDDDDQSGEDSGEEVIENGDVAEEEDDEVDDDDDDDYDNGDDDDDDDDEDAEDVSDDAEEEVNEVEIRDEGVKDEAIKEEEIEEDEVFAKVPAESASEDDNKATASGNGQASEDTSRRERQEVAQQTEAIPPAGNAELMAAIVAELARIRSHMERLERDRQDELERRRRDEELLARQAGGQTWRTTLGGGLWKFLWG